MYLCTRPLAIGLYILASTTLRMDTSSTSGLNHAAVKAESICGITPLAIGVQKGDIRALEEIAVMLGKRPSALLPLRDEVVNKIYSMASEHGVALPGFDKNEFDRPVVGDSPIGTECNVYRKFDDESP